MTAFRYPIDRAQLLRARALCREVRALTGETQRTLEQTRRILAGHKQRGQGPAERPAAQEPDGLCRLFDSLLEVCRHADADGDAETIALIERAVLHVGGRIDRRLDPLEKPVELQ